MYPDVRFVVPERLKEVSGRIRGEPQRLGVVAQADDDDTYLVVLPDLTHEVRERLVDVDSLLRRGLDELAAKVLREVTPLCYTETTSGFIEFILTKSGVADDRRL